MGDRGAVGAVGAVVGDAPGEAATGGVEAGERDVAPARGEHALSSATVSSASGSMWRRERGVCRIVLPHSGRLLTAHLFVRTPIWRKPTIAVSRGQSLIAKLAMNRRCDAVHECAPFAPGAPRMAYAGVVPDVRAKTLR